MPVTLTKKLFASLLILSTCHTVWGSEENPRKRKDNPVPASTSHMAKKARQPGQPISMSDILNSENITPHDSIQQPLTWPIPQQPQNVLENVPEALHVFSRRRPSPVTPELRQQKVGTNRRPHTKDSRKNTRVIQDQDLFASVSLEKTPTTATRQVPVTPSASTKKAKKLDQQTDNKPSQKDYEASFHLSDMQEQIEQTSSGAFRIIPPQIVFGAQKKQFARAHRATDSELYRQQQSSYANNTDSDDDDDITVTVTDPSSDSDD